MNIPVCGGVDGVLSSERRHAGRYGDSLLDSTSRPNRQPQASNDLRNRVARVGLNYRSVDATVGSETPPVPEDATRGRLTQGLSLEQPCCAREGRRTSEGTATHAPVEKGVPQATAPRRESQTLRSRKCLDERQEERGVDARAVARRRADGTGPHGRREAVEARGRRRGVEQVRLRRAQHHPRRVAACVEIKSSNRARTRASPPCFENSTRAIDSSKNQPNRLRFDRARDF